MKEQLNFFATANTGNGFVSYLDKVNIQSSNSFLYILKGGSGTGKSSLMKKIAQHFLDKNFTVEKFFCSTDTLSLDGVRIVEKNLAIIDGTSPHIVNANLAGVDSKIIDLGSAISPNIISQRKILEELLQKKKCEYEKMFECLASAKKLDDVNHKIFLETKDDDKIKKLAKEIFSKIPKAKTEKHTPRNLFLQSFNFLHNNLEYENNFQKIYFEADRFEGFYVLKVLQKILEKNNIPYDIVRDNLNVEYISGIIINNKILIKNKENKLKINKKIKKNNIFIKKIINLGLNNLREAKRLHNKIEEIYLPYVNFNKVNNMGKILEKEISVR